MSEALLDPALTPFTPCWKRPSFHTGTLDSKRTGCFTPPELGLHDPAGQAQPIVRHDQQETIRNSARLRQFYRSPGDGQVTDYAIDRHAADEFDGGGFRDAEARGDPGFDHRVKRYIRILSY